MCVCQVVSALQGAIAAYASKLRAVNAHGGRRALPLRPRLPLGRGAGADDMGATARVVAPAAGAEGPSVDLSNVVPLLETGGGCDWWRWWYVRDTGAAHLGGSMLLPKELSLLKKDVATVVDSGGEAGGGLLPLQFLFCSRSRNRCIGDGGVSCRAC